MNNSEILFLYDAKLTNPNGDIDEENRPRMDYERSLNLVSDVRLKRYIRDYLDQIGYEIFVAKVEGNTVNATERLNKLFSNYEKKVELRKKLDPEVIDWLLDQLIDVRLFGATMPIKSEDKGNSITFTGPVQFNWGYSLNKVTLVESASITSHFGSENQNEGGSIGKDYRVYYSFLAFHGIISGHRAKYTRLKNEDVRLLDQAMVKAIPLNATRSKVGQYPRLYLRVEYNSPEFVAGDFRDLVSLNETEGLRGISEVELQADRLLNKLTEIKEEIAKIYFWQDTNLILEGHGQKGTLPDLLSPDLKEKLVSAV
ncbi:MAG: type I-B CRISPR-associated protein Cas7/Csh2 [Caldibacillus debilis]|uniref:type I-B CRISPR-associated protein Cas7/Csh2 n=1 Tax=Caldibacillus debilis TaxID=301148 RepID=UPI000E3AB883|nr:type I-B CRISPR-associated protein Cas7/Csh2 [Caldibacillus debilis]REJ16315.1 MAG: type I-B CRISPR-associated protein Cas7/Csh2 [Caldibacillus debilis]